MCQMMGTPYGGIAILQETHDQFPQDVKDAWAKFHAWWSKQEETPKTSDMPADVAAALQTMRDAPVPGQDGLFGRDSCYVKGVERLMAEQDSI